MKYLNSLNRINSVLTAVLLLVAILLGSTSQALADQSNTITGTVKSAADNMGLPGVSILVKGSNTGTVTTPDGKYSINAPANATLIFSFIGFQTQEIPVAGKSVIDVVMMESTEAIDEVVVTALGIKREEKSLGYSVGKVSGEELTRVVQENVLNSMAGKVTGVTISSTGGTGSSVSMIIRGATSMSTDNQPLFVVDGIPMASTINNVGGFGSDNRVDYGNAVSDLDPESIESVSILKGPSAAALYGTRAGNGVVLITTKKAKEKQGMKVEVTSNTVFDIPSKYLDIQSRLAFGARSYIPDFFADGIIPPFSPAERIGAGPELDKGYWQVQPFAPLDANGVPVPTELKSYPNNYKDFINHKAFTTTNGVSVYSTSDKINYRLGVSNMTNKGLIPNSDLNRNNLTLSASSKVKQNFTVNTDLSYTHNWADNRPSTQETGTNPLQWAAWTPPNMDIHVLEDYDLGGGQVKNIGSSFDNPYYLAYGVNNSFSRNRFMGNLQATWEIAPKLSVMGRYSLNKTDEIRETKMDPGYSKEPNNGTYGIITSEGLEQNIDALLTFKDNWGDFNLTASAGGNLLYSRGSSISNSAKPGSGLNIPYVYTVQNISNTALNYSNGRSERAINSIYALANLGWKDMIYLDLTARNDWSSTLPAENRSYFYPSASLSLMINNMIDMGSKINLFKVRAGAAQVGNDTSPYSLYSTYYDAGQWGDAIRLGKPGSLLNPNLLPEEATSYEIGFDFKGFDNRLHFEGTYYNEDNRNQILGVPLAGSTGFGSIKVNAGLLQSKGWEFSLGYTVVKSNDWTWDLTANFTANDTYLLELTEGVDFVEFWDGAKVKNIAWVKGNYAGPDGQINTSDDIKQDGLIGNLYTRKLVRVTDKNSPYYNYPLLENEDGYLFWGSAEDYTKIGNYNPDFIMGFQSALTYKNFSLNLTFDWRSGGQYASQTYHYLIDGGISKSRQEQIVNPPQGLGGQPSQALQEWVVANADQLIYSDKFRVIGGVTKEDGGFYTDFYTGLPAYDGNFIAGVTGHYDENGSFILEKENLGGPGTSIVPYAGTNPWDFGEAKTFDADYIKLREIALSYNLPSKYTSKIGVSDVNFSIYSRNIMIWAKDTGMGIDPERAYQSESSGRFRQGIERFNAEPWTIPVGFKIGFSF